MFIFRAYADSSLIYCYHISNNQYFNPLLNINVNLGNSEEVLVFEINDEKKTFKQIRSYRFKKEDILPEGKGHYSNNFDYEGIENTKSGYKIIDEEKKNKVNELNQKFIAFDSNKIISFIDYKYKEKNRRFYDELDRVSGILVQTSGILIDRYGNEYVEDDGMTYLRNSIYFQNHVYANKYVCENNKKL